MYIMKTQIYNVLTSMVLISIPVLIFAHSSPPESAADFVLHSAVGAITNSGISQVTGNVGTNSGSISGFGNVSGATHENEGSTDQFENNLVLTPHTYLLNAATVFMDALYLDTLGNVNAVFVIRINCALTTGTYSKVLFIDEAQAKNGYWKIEGAVDINDNSAFGGTIVCNNGAIDLNTGVSPDGRALITVGALSTNKIRAVAVIPSGCVPVCLPSLDEPNAIEAVTFNPNPFMTSTTVRVKDAARVMEVDLRVYNVLGKLVINTILTKQLTILEATDLPSGMYFYEVINKEKTIQSNKLVSR
jgi:hypothetical protein